MCVYIEVYPYKILKTRTERWNAPVPKRSMPNTEPEWQLEWNYKYVNNVVRQMRWLYLAQHMLAPPLTFENATSLNTMHRQ